MPVAGTQNTEASLAFAGTFVKTIPAGEPFSLIVRQAVLPKQPAWVPPSWPVQNRPVELVALAGPVVSGETLMGITPKCEPSQQLPPPIKQGQLQRGWQVCERQSASVVHAFPVSVQTLAAQKAGETQSASVVHGVAKSSEQTGPQQFPFPVCPPGHGLVWVPTPPVGQSRV
jgi:hypothetical protein